MIAQVRSPRERARLGAFGAPHLWAIVLSGEPSRFEHAAGSPALRAARLHRAPRACTGAVADTTLRQTVERAARLVARERIMPVVARSAAPMTENALGGLGCGQRVVQPAYRGSAAEVFLPLLKIARQDPHAIVVVLPPVQLVEYEARFMHYVAKAASAASVRPDLPVVIGAHPRTPDPDPDWIEAGPPVEGLEYCSARSVKRVVRRPSPAEAEALFEDGSGLLNTRVIAAHARTLIDIGAHYLPDVLETLEPLEDAFGGPEEALLCEAVYECMPSVSLSEGLRDGWREFAVLPIPEAMWSDRSRPALQALAS